MSNNEQREFWNGEIGARWVREQADLDKFIAPFGEEVMTRAHIAAGERVLDVGCGCGTTSIAIASRVGEKGRVLGLDLSAPMLARARESAAKIANSSSLEFREGDASEAQINVGAFDLLFSRFGIMFFAEPVRAFAHLKNALSPNGRIAFVCWRPLAENPWAKVPFDAIVEALGPMERTPPRAPGPFAFAEESYLRETIEGAGFRGVTISRFDRDGVLGETLGEATSAALKLGPAARAYNTASEEDKPKAMRSLESALAKHLKDGAVRLGLSTWIVTGKAS